MKTKFKIVILALSATLSLSQVARAQPTITLPPDEKPPEQPKSGIPRPAALQLPRENQIEVPLEQPAMSGTAVGGYGELVLNSPSNSPTVIDLRRLVIFVGHNFTDKLRFYGELEMEHAVTSSSDKGEFEVEQAFLDYLAWRPLNLRAGVIIIPMGIVNVFHEPPSFNGADRPETDQRVIPSTWREPGAGVFGAWKALRYQLYVVNGFNASGFSAGYGLREGHQEAQLALGHDWGVVARVDYNGLFAKLGLALDVGASFYYSHADQGQAKFKGADGDTVPVTMAEADLRARARGLELRFEYAHLWIGGIHRLDRALAADAATAMMDFAPVSHQLFGTYVELGYNVLHEAKLRLGMQLTPFIRYEHVDTQADTPVDLGGRVPGNKLDIVTVGLTFRPIAEVAVKLDYQRRLSDAVSRADAAVDQWNAALGFMF
jgi:hypothetical protein